MQYMYFNFSISRKSHHPRVVQHLHNKMGVVAVGWGNVMQPHRWCAVGCAPRPWPAQPEGLVPLSALMSGEGEKHKPCQTAFIQESFWKKHRRALGTICTCNCQKIHFTGKYAVLNAVTADRSFEIICSSLSLVVQDVLYYFSNSFFMANGLNSS